MNDIQKKNKKSRTTAIVLAAGQGKRMGTDVAKQFLMLRGKPILYYSLSVFERSSYVDDIILVTNEDGLSVCEAIIRENDFTKVSSVVLGGKERYHSVWAGLKTAFYDEGEEGNEAEIAPKYVLIHDGARPFITEEIIKRNMEALLNDAACVTAVPSKDTIKIADENGYVDITPDRSLVWNIQTPQSFDFSLVYEAYHKLIRDEKEISDKGIHITDDAMVVEYFENVKVRLIEGSYENIKITTPDDLILAEKIYECH